MYLLLAKRFSSSARHKRMPLIRFLGPRSQLPNGGHHSSTSSPKSNAPSQQRPAPAATGKGSTDVIHYEEESELPPRFRKMPMSRAEMEVIELGGAF
ncbi:hypothetical protein SeMB42_g00463 [Synchytrium endobioticum]|uniref:Ribosomal protein S36, mitochondrial n=1 Tax=Synchytrium endobioticum TaxID=286115 RepID=A0A507DI60_9FUNG|nr:hypothetical protein SeLEV6574_g00326 [Synchytrium endobioticum]TPX54067.1 hypothetical protein SeMB42_g00463 [Synchytrium endobioticum]